MEIIPFSKARNELTHIINQVAFGHDRLILTRNGKNVAAIIPMEDLKLLEELEDRLDLEVAKKVDADVKKHGTVSWEKAQRELGL